MSSYDPEAQKDFAAWLATKDDLFRVAIATRAALRLAPVLFLAGEKSIEHGKLAAIAICGLMRAQLHSRSFEVNLLGFGAIRTLQDEARYLRQEFLSSRDSIKVSARNRIAEPDTLAAAIELVTVTQAKYLYEYYCREVVRHSEVALGRMAIDLLLDDARQIQVSGMGSFNPLWGLSKPALSHYWLPVRSAWKDKGSGWSFLATWYEDTLSGVEPDWRLLSEVALIPEDDWKVSPDRINALIEEILARRNSKIGTALTRASVTDFTFDALHRRMKSIGFEDDLAHLRDPRRVQAFLDDIEEVRDGLADFCDYAADARGRTNAPVVLLRATEKTLEELRRTKDTSHLRARRIVTLGWQLEGFANEEAKREEIGGTLAQMLDENVALLRNICRKHLLSSIDALSALGQLELGDIDPKDLIARLEAAIDRVDRADGSHLVPLRHEDVVMLRDMLDDLKTIEVSIGEARTERFADQQRSKLARGGGALGATLGKYFEKSARHAADAGKTFDASVKWYQRWETLNDIWGWLDKLPWP